MDASTPEDLLPLYTLFYTHNYPSVLAFDLAPLPTSSRKIASILQSRSQIALGQSSSVLSQRSKTRDLASRALCVLASNSLSDAQTLATSSADSEDPTVQICCGTVLANHGEYKSAIELLQKHQGNLEAVLLLTQIYLTMNRTDLARKTVDEAKRWANDSLLINLAEAWVRLRVGGREEGQGAYYVFEELAQSNGNKGGAALVAQAVSEIHLGRFEEAEVALDQVLESGQGGDALVNAVVLKSVMGKGKEASALLERLRNNDSEHIFLADLHEKERLFDEGAAKYTAKVAG